MEANNGTDSPDESSRQPRHVRQGSATAVDGVSHGIPLPVNDQRQARVVNSGTANRRAPPSGNSAAEVQLQGTTSSGGSDTLKSQTGKVSEHK